MVTPSPDVDVLIPTYRRPTALAVTLAGLVGQGYPSFRVIISDQTEDHPSYELPEVETVCRVLEIRGHPVERHHHVPRQGIAEQRQFLLEQATAPYALFLDDDVILESDLIERLVRAIRRYRCGFVGSALVGPHYVGDRRPDQEAAFERWVDRVEPEAVRPGSPEWQRASLHLAANPHHIAQRLGAERQDDLAYRVAWVGGCCLYDRESLVRAGGFQFWRHLPDHHVGEDVLAQLQVMERDGGCAILPSGVWHQDRIETTHPDRQHDAPWLLLRERSRAGRA
jgi:GT2 family glycosyltransferase